MKTLSIECAEIRDVADAIRKAGARSALFCSARAPHEASPIAYVAAQRLAAEGARTLLIDLNMAHPYTTEILALPQSPWRLSDSDAVCDAIFEIPTRSLSILTPPSGAGVPLREQSEIAVRRFLDTLKERFDVVVIDGPGVIDRGAVGVSALLLAACCDAVLLGVSTGETATAAVAAAKARFDARNISLSGVVMDDAAFPPLKEELRRQASKISPIAPKVANWLVARINASRLLDVDY
ncbi:MAG: hypothetical protein AAGJ87_08305 [Pseudomonadota bacterium]